VELVGTSNIYAEIETLVTVPVPLPRDDGGWYNELLPYQYPNESVSEDCHLNGCSLYDTASHPSTTGVWLAWSPPKGRVLGRARTTTSGCHRLLDTLMHHQVA
jgi:hypothetical protein